MSPKLWKRTVPWTAASPPPTGPWKSLRDSHSSHKHDGWLTQFQQPEGRTIRGSACLTLTGSHWAALDTP